MCISYAIALSIFILFFPNLGSCQKESNKQWTITSYIKDQGYPIETHTMETPDGYILKTQRIPHGRSAKVSDKIILLAHGMSGSAENWISLGPDNALAFYLADRGFDVWLFNARGTHHSRKHRKRSPNFLQGAGFWNFSWHEIGYYDVPTNIDYILKKTNTRELFYVGHSQGGTAFLVMTSERPEYNKKIKAAVLLSPGAFTGPSDSLLVNFASRFYIIIKRIVAMFNYYELVIPNSISLNKILKHFCMTTDNFMEACLDLIILIGGQQSGLFNTSLLPDILDHTPSGFSVQQALHYIQNMRSGRFQQYDHGKKVNMIKYKNATPPEYALNNSVVPTAIFMANGDLLVSVKQMREISEMLPNVAMKYEVPYKNFNHIDYIFAINAKEIVYKPLYDFLMQFVNVK